MVPLLHYRHGTAVCNVIRVREIGVGVIGVREIWVKEIWTVCACVGVCVSVYAGKGGECVCEREIRR